MKLSKLHALALASVLSFGALPALADATGIGTGIAGADASANVTTGKSYALGGSVGAAECANAFNILGIGASQSDKGCELVKSSIAAYQAGMISKGEARAIYFAGVEDMGVKLRYPGGEATAKLPAPAKATAAEPAPTASLPASLTLKVDGKRIVLRDAQLASYEACKPMKLAETGTVFKKPGC